MNIETMDINHHNDIYFNNNLNIPGESLQGRGVIVPDRKADPLPKDEKTRAIEEESRTRIDSILDRADDLTAAKDYYQFGKRKGQVRSARLNMQGRQAISGKDGYTEKLKGTSIDAIFQDYRYLNERLTGELNDENSEIEIEYTVEERAIMRSMREAAYLQLQYRVQDILKKQSPEMHDAWLQNMYSLSHDAQGNKVDHISMREIYLDEARAFIKAGIDVNTVKPIEIAPREEKTKWQKAANFLMQKANGFMRIAGLLSPATAIIPPAEYTPPITSSIVVDRPTPPSPITKDNPTRGLNYFNAQPQATEAPAAPENFTTSSIGKNRAEPSPTPEVVPTTLATPEPVITRTEPTAKTETLPPQEPFTIGRGTDKLRLMEVGNEQTAPQIRCEIPALDVRFGFKPRLWDPEEIPNPLNQEYNAVAQLSVNGDMLTDFHDQFYPMKADPADTKHNPPWPKDVATFQKFQQEHDEKDIIWWEAEQTWLIANNGEWLRRVFDGETSKKPLKTVQEIEDTIAQTNGTRFTCEQTIDGKKVVRTGTIKTFHLDEDATTDYYADKSRLLELIKAKYGNGAVPESSWNNLYATYCGLRPKDAPEATKANERLPWSAWMYATVFMFDDQA